MDSHSMAIIIAIVVLLALSAYFSAAKTVFTSLSKIKIKHMVADGVKGADLLLRLMEAEDKLISTVVISKTIVNITLAVIAASWVMSLIDRGGAFISIILITAVLLIFGEMSPKIVAREFAEHVALNMAPVLRALMVVLTPVTWLLAQWGRLIARIFKLTKPIYEIEEELITIVEEAETEGSIGNEQSELIQNAIEFDDLQAWDVLTPRIDLIALDIEEDEEAITQLFRETGFSRIPVYEGEIDNILGILSQKDFHNYIKGYGKNIGAYIKPVVFVAGSIKIAVLLKKMQTAKTHIAVVIDEYGGTEGIVTMEDIIEELVGEIYDEHDPVTSQDILQLRDESYRVLGSANLEKMLDFFDVECEEIDVTTVNGWAVVALDNLPKVGDTFEQIIDNKLFICRVTKADDRRAQEINIKVKQLSEKEQI